MHAFLIIHSIRMLLLLVIVTQEILSEGLRDPFLKEDVAKIQASTVDIDKPTGSTSLSPTTPPKPALLKAVDSLQKQKLICLGITSTPELKLAIIQTPDGALVLVEQGETISNSNITIRAIHERKVTIYLKNEKQYFDLLVN